MNCWICKYELDGPSCRMKSDIPNFPSARAYDSHHADIRAMQLSEIAREKRPRDFVSGEEV